MSKMRKTIRDDVESHNSVGATCSFLCVFLGQLGAISWESTLKLDSDLVDYHYNKMLNYSYPYYCKETCVLTVNNNPDNLISILYDLGILTYDEWDKMDTLVGEYILNE